MSDCNPIDCSRPRFPVHHQLPELVQTQVHWVGDAIQPFQPLSSPSSLPSIFPSIRVFSKELVLPIRWPKYWSFSISPSNEYSGLISFRIDRLDLLAVQRTCKSLLQHHSSKASILEWVAISYSRGYSWPRDYNLLLYYLLHWQADSLPLCYLGSPNTTLDLSQKAKKGLLVARYSDLNL